jgi:nucleotide-binding universal stress UspA family protein
MNKYTQGTVVVPWDFSSFSESALKEALEMVDSPAKIAAIHVTPYPAATEYGVIWNAMPEANIITNLEKSFAEAMKQNGNTDISFDVKFGDPGSQIAEFAKEKEASLVMISSHGHTGLPRFFLGSVAERVVRLAPCPVLVLRGNSQE